MADLSALSGDAGVAFMVAAGLVYEIIAAACSSPQTAEINAHKRSATLMKWVKLGLAQVILFIAIAMYLGRKQWRAIMAGGVLASVVMYGMYVYANRAGLASTAPGTESY